MLDSIGRPPIAVRHANYSATATGLTVLYLNIQGIVLFPGTVEAKSDPIIWHFFTENCMKTRMYFSRMRTAHLLTVSAYGGGGGGRSGVICLKRGLGSAYRGDPPMKIIFLY